MIEFIIGFFIGCAITYYICKKYPDLQIWWKNK